MAHHGKIPVAWTISSEVEVTARSFIEALREKYLADDTGSQCTNGLVIKIDIRGKPKDHSEGKAELGFLRNVVLCIDNITHAGLPENGLKYLCPNVVDLDISGNYITSWNDIIAILCQLPRLKYVNLSGNPLKEDKESLQDDTLSYPAVENLVLNGTFISWETISVICKRLPTVRELHICHNGYKDIHEESVPFLSNVECLRLNNNCIHRWKEVHKLSSLPKLTSLIVSENPLIDVFYVKGSSKDLPKCHNEDNTHYTATGSANPSSTTEEIHIQELSAESQQQQCLLNTASAVCQNIINEVFENVILMAQPMSSDNDKSTISTQGENEGQACPMQDQQFGTNKTTVDLTADGFSQPEMNCQEGETTVFQQHQLSLQAESDQNCTKSSTKMEQTPQPFASLESLCISNTHVSSFEHFEALSEFPKLHSVRIKNKNIFPGVSQKDKRKLLVACLPNVTVLNGSEVSSSERYESENHFLQHFKTSSDKPAIYDSLVEKHGKPFDLAHIDFSASFCEWAEISVVKDNVPVHKFTAHVTEPTGKLRKYISQKVLGARFGRAFRMYHYACGPYHLDKETTFEELICDALPLSRFNVLPGDEIHIELLEHNNIPVRIYDRLSNSGNKTRP